MAAPPRGKKLSARVDIPAATCTAAKSHMAVAAAAAGRDPAAAAAANTTTGTIQAATTAAAISDRGETNLTVLRRHTTTDFGETPVGGDFKDAAHTAAAAATKHRQCLPEQKSCPDGKQ